VTTLGSIVDCCSSSKAVRGPGVRTILQQVADCAGMAIACCKHQRGLSFAIPRVHQACNDIFEALTHVACNHPAAEVWALRPVANLLDDHPKDVHVPVLGSQVPRRRMLSIVFACFQQVQLCLPRVAVQRGRNFIQLALLCGVQVRPAVDIGRYG
jgi:hypothetical protein